ANPTVTISPSSQEGTAGQTLTYSIKIKNNDNSACGGSNFDLSVSLCPNELTCKLATTTLTIEPASEKETQISVTSATTASGGKYTFKVKVTNREDKNYMGEGEAIYIVSPAAIITFICGSNNACPSGQTCECKSNCEAGYLDLYSRSDCSGSPDKSSKIADGKTTITITNKVYGKVRCDQPEGKSECQSIDISTVKEFRVSSWECEGLSGRGRCRANYENGIGEDISLVFILMDEEGRTITTASATCSVGSGTSPWAMFYCGGPVTSGKYRVRWIAYKASGEDITWSKVAEEKTITINCG
ncbi:MAG: hypothetical protein QXI58_04350, partial [Candidatus Micrarchaeia archaeon]